MSTQIDGPYRPDGRLCFRCVHHRIGTYTCDAFPDAIPPVIWNSQEGHEQPYPGDHGIQFREMTPDERQERDEELYRRIEERRRLVLKRRRHREVRDK